MTPTHDEAHMNQTLEETLSEPFTLPGEGERKIVERVRVREECEQCGEPATKKHTFLLYNARSNPASSGYGKDDISWCSDLEAFACGDCPEPSAPDGYKWCSTFTIEPGKTRFAHMFLRWSEREVEQEYKDILEKNAAYRDALEKYEQLDGSTGNLARMTLRKCGAA